MNFKLTLITSAGLPKVLMLFKLAAEKIARKNIDHWQYWKNPPSTKIEWVKNGISKQEFFFIKSNEEEIIGMVRVLNEDLLYWGEKEDKAKYVHSLVVTEKHNGKQLGSRVLTKIEKDAQKDNVKYLRLDCDSKNPKLCAYYEKLGFLKVGKKTLPLSTYNLYQKRILPKN